MDDQSLAKLEAQNLVLREHLAEYKALEEDLLSQKVYEKARKLIIGWLSIGGVFLTLFSILGITSIVEKAEEHSDRIINKKVEDLVKDIASDEKITKIVDEKLDSQVSKITEKQQQDFQTLRKEIAGIRSKQGEIKTSIKFTNHLQENVKVLWVDYEGNEVLYKTLEPDKSYIQQTFVTHPWIVRAESDNRQVEFIVGVEQSRTLNIGSKEERFVN